jgi:dolichol-phosphate mannosyltransferase
MNSTIYDVSIVLPTFNERENVEVMIPKIDAALKACGISGEIVVVDDNSPDGTAEYAQSLASHFPVRVIKRVDERGLASAVLAGFSSSSATVCLVMDADASHPTDSLESMIRPILDGQTDITIGSRYIKGGGMVGWPLYRQWMSRGAAWLTVGITALTDATSGFMGIRRDRLDTSVLNPIGWKIVLEIIIKHPHLTVKEVPIIFYERLLGESKMGMKEQWQYIVHVMHLYRHRFPTFLEFFLFCLVGLSGVLVDFSVGTALRLWLNADIRVCALAGFLAALTSNYVLNRVWTFPNAQRHAVLSSYALFLLVSLVGFSTRLTFIQLLLSTGILIQHQLIINSLGLLVGAIVNFVGTRAIVFRQWKL